MRAHFDALRSRNYTPLSAEDEQRLFRELRRVEAAAAKCRHGQERPCPACRSRVCDALEAVVGPLLPWAVSLARRYSRYALTMEERVSAAHLGVMLAARKFDLTRGLRFSTYATMAIKRVIGAEADNANGL